jgi:hypothetical protein
MTTLTNSFAGAVLVLTDPSTAEETAAYVASTYLHDSEYHFVVTESTPAHLPDSIRSDITSKQAAIGSDTHVLTVYPWAQAESKLAERPTNGKIPS